MGHLLMAGASILLFRDYTGCVFTHKVLVVFKGECPDSEKREQVWSLFFQAHKRALDQSPAGACQQISAAKSKQDIQRLGQHGMPATLE